MATPQQKQYKNYVAQEENVLFREEMKRDYAGAWKPAWSTYLSSEFGVGEYKVV